MSLLGKILFVTLSAFGDSIPEIDNAVIAFMVANQVPGASLAISKNERIVYAKGYGFSDREKGSHVETQSLFRIASISKPVTSVAIMKLVEEKKLSLDDRVFGPQGILKNRYGHPPYSKDITDITVRHLLQHLSGGWGNQRNDPMFTDPNRDVKTVISITLDSLALQRVPGTGYQYSNFGYCVLGRVIEQVTGQPYETWVKTNILLPAGAAGMQVGGNTLIERKTNEVIYYGQNGEDPYRYNIVRMDAHGGWIASASDLANFVSHVDGKNGVKDIISPASVTAMLTAPSVSPKYACGWGVDSLGNWGHNGSLPGTRTELKHTANGYTYALLLNTRSFSPQFDKDLRALMNLLQSLPVVTTGKPEKVVSGYKPAIFMDSNRIIRMQAAFPVIEKMYKAHMEQQKIPGFAFGIVAEGKLVYSGAFGYSDVENKVPVTTKSVFRIASMSKSFAGLAIIKLRDEGRLRLDDPVSKYIPEINNIAALTDDSQPITIRNLISHTAGFPEDNPWGDRQLQDTDQELLDFIKGGLSLSSTPGLAYEYSNLGFAMLGIIITRASGMHYEQYINTRIFQPLGMANTYWEYAEVPKDLLVNGYRIVNDKWTKEEMLHRGAYGIMGGMLTSIEDFAKYMNLHISAWPPRSGENNGIVSRSSIREMQLPGPVSNLSAFARKVNGEICARISSYNFGLAWSKDCMGREQIGHSGGLPGFGTHWTFLPQYGFGIVSFSSLTYAATVALNQQLVDTLIAIADLQPRRLPPSDILEKRKKELVALLPDWKNAEQSGIFSENFFADYFVDSLRKYARILFAKAGPIIKVSDMMPDNQLRGNFIIEGINSKILVRFTLSPENPALVQWFSMRELPPSANSHFNKYRLKTINTIEEHIALVERDPKQELVALDKFIPGIQLDVRYATDSNLMKRPVYSSKAAYMRKPAAESLKKIQAELKKKGLGLKIYDAYRPYDVTVSFYETFRDTVFVASPYSGSRHNRGCAVDLTIIDLKTGKELDMPTPWDSFSSESHSDYPLTSKSKLKNRELLKKVMTENGFLIYPDEWWHYDFGGWKEYPVMDIPFEKLKALE